ncbi:MAG: hypothetical protein GX639_04590 [Fibrobacter sp.]|nr:hypothetical protein [Fibrobacter sp.]
MGGCCIRNCCVMNCGLVDKIKEFFGFCSDSGCCKGYRSGPNETERHATKISNELAEMKERKHSEWNAAESKMLELINSEMSSLLTELEKINKQLFGGKALNIDIEGVKAKAKEIENEVVGYVGRVFDERLVLTDKELSIILEERDDKKRTKNFDSFCQKIHKQALTGLRGKIQATVAARNDAIVKTITIRLEEINSSIQQEAEAYRNLLATKKKKESEAPIQMRHIYQHGICEVLLKLTN